MILKITKIFLKASWKDKKEIIKYFYNNAKKRFIDYWLGSVDVYVQDIQGNYLQTTSKYKQISTEKIRLACRNNNWITDSSSTFAYA